MPIRTSDHPYGSGGDGDGGTDASVTSTSILDVAQASRDATSRGKVLAVSDTDEDDLILDSPSVITPNADDTWPDPATNDGKILVVPGGSVYHVAKDTTTETPNTVTWSTTIPDSYNVLGAYNASSDRPTAAAANVGKRLYLISEDRWQVCVRYDPSAFIDPYYEWTYSHAPTGWIGAYDTEAEADDHTTAVNDIAYWGDALQIATAFTDGTAHQNARWEPITAAGGDAPTLRTVTDALGLTAPAVANRSKIIQRKTDDTGYQYADLPAGGVVDATIVDGINRVKRLTEDLTPVTEPTDWVNNNDAVVGGISTSPNSLGLSSAATLTYFNGETDEVTNRRFYVRLRAGDDPKKASVRIVGGQYTYRELVSHLTSLGNNGSYDYYRDDQGLLGDIVTDVYLDVTASDAHIGTSTYGGVLTGEAGTGTVDADSLVTAVSERLLPTPPVAGSRANRFPLFVGDNLMWVQRPIYSQVFQDHSMTANVSAADTWYNSPYQLSTETPIVDIGGWTLATGNTGVVVPAAIAGLLIVDIDLFMSRIASTTVDLTETGADVRNTLYARLAIIRNSTRIALPGVVSVYHRGTVRQGQRDVSLVLQSVIRVQGGDIITLDIKQLVNNGLWYGLNGGNSFMNLIGLA